MNLVYPRWPCSHEHANWTRLHRTNRVSAVVKSGSTLTRQCLVCIIGLGKGELIGCLSGGGVPPVSGVPSGRAGLRVIRGTVRLLAKGAASANLALPKNWCPYLLLGQAATTCPLPHALVLWLVAHSEGNYFKCQTDFLASLSIKSTKLALTSSVLPHLHFSN